MILGISGKKQHGKDTVASIIQYLIFTQNVQFRSWYYKDFLNYLPNGHYETGWHKKQFAGKLKEIVALLIGCTVKQLEDNTFKEKELGEEWRVHYLSHYKLGGNRIGKIYSSKEELQQHESSTFFKSLNLEGYKVETKILTPRLLLQLMGTECGRDIIHPNIWVNALMNEYKTDEEIVRSIEGFGGIDSVTVKRNGVASRIIDEYIVPESPNYPKHLWNNKINTLNFYWHETIDKKDLKMPNWIITDVRFPNEAQAVKDRGGIIIRVERPIKQYQRTCLICKTGFDLGEIMYSGTSDEIEVCPDCKSLSHAAVYYEKDNHFSEIALDNHSFHYTITNDGTIEQLIEAVKLVLQDLKIIQ